MYSGRPLSTPASLTHHSGAVELRWLRVTLHYGDSHMTTRMPHRSKRTPPPADLPVIAAAYAALKGEPYNELRILDANGVEDWLAEVALRDGTLHVLRCEGGHVRDFPLKLR